MTTERRNNYLALAKLRLGSERATLGVLHAITLIEAAMPLPGTPEHRAAFAWAHGELERQKGGQEVA